MNMEKYDIIIVGAGAAGLLAAKMLSDAKMKVCIIEARDRIGGRIHTVSKPGFSRPVEAGAEFIHGKLPLTMQLLKESVIPWHATDGTLWQVKDDQLKRREDFIEHADQLMKTLHNLDHDITIAELLEKYFPGDKYTEMKHSLQQYVEGYDAADIHEFSAFALKEDWEAADEQQYRSENGYLQLIRDLQTTILQNGSSIFLNTTVKNTMER